MRKTTKKVTRKKATTRKKAVAAVVNYPVIASQDTTRFQLAKDSIRDIRAGWRRSVRFVDLAVALLNLHAQNLTRINVTAKAGSSAGYHAVVHNPTARVLAIGCQHFTGTAYERLMARITATGLYNNA
jgi:hypothetical protein